MNRAAQGQASIVLLPDAERELTFKTRSDIERETAWKWAARAVAAYRRSVSSNDGVLLRDAIDYYHEAVEHAAFADLTGAVLSEVREWVLRYVPRGAV